MRSNLRHCFSSMTGSKMSAFFWNSILWKLVVYVNRTFVWTILLGDASANWRNIRDVFGKRNAIFGYRPKIVKSFRLRFTLIIRSSVLFCWYLNILNIREKVIGTNATQIKVSVGDCRPPERKLCLVERFFCALFLSERLFCNFSQTNFVESSNMNIFITLHTITRVPYRFIGLRLFFMETRFREAKKELGLVDQ